MSNKEFIHFSLPSIGEEEEQEIINTLRSGWLTTGQKTLQFEREFASYVQAPHALGVNSCTAALHLALAALNIGTGDEVITTPLTFCATVNTILHVGAVPILADVGPDGNIDPHSIRDRITPRTKALMPVHLAGLPCDMDAIWSIAREHGLEVIEDAAHAIGSQYRGRPVGAASDANAPRSTAVAFSFYATKSLTTGEGGMVTTYDPRLVERMRMLSLHGISKDAWKRYTEHGSWYYEVAECGYKYNLSDIQSAIGIHQLRKQERFLARRREIAGLYGRYLSAVDEIELPRDDPACRHAWHLFIVRLKLERLRINRADFIEELRRQGIGASVHFIPISLHPYFSDHASRPCNYCPTALELYPRLLSLPLHCRLTDQDVERVATSVKAIVGASLARGLVAVSD